MKDFNKYPMLGRGFTFDDNGFLYKNGKPLTPFKHPNSTNVYFRFTIEKVNYRIDLKDVLKFGGNAQPQVAY